MVYRKAPSKTFFLRVVDASGNRRICSTGTPLKTSATAVEAWVVSIRHRLDPHGVLRAITAREVSLIQAFQWGEAATRTHLDAQAADAADLDLRPLFVEWLAWRGQRAKGLTVVPIYQQQLERLYPEAAWRQSTFTAPEFLRRLDALDGVGDPTRNRYRAALSAFCKYLVRRGVLVVNPTKQFEGFSESIARVVWYEVADAQRIIAALPAAFAAREALMAGAGLDWSDCARLRRRDIDLTARTVRCHGSKTRYRNRVVRITEAWTIPAITDALRGMLPDAVVLPTHPHKAALTAHHATLAALGLADSTLHDWRHHYAVTALRRGELPQIVAHQLGHGNTKQVLDRYGRFVPRTSDYLTESAASPATDLAPDTLSQRNG